MPHDPSHLKSNYLNIGEIIYKNGPELKNICKEIPGSGLGHVALMHNSIWKKYRGYNEKFIHYGWQEEEMALE